MTDAALILQLSEVGRQDGAKVGQMNGNPR